MMLRDNCVMKPHRDVLRLSLTLKRRRIHHERRHPKSIQAMEQCQHYDKH